MDDHVVAARRGTRPRMAYRLSRTQVWTSGVTGSAAQAFAVSEVSGYWGHRMSHQLPVLWRFHRVHHSSRQLDWLAPNRRHPIDLVVARVSTSLPVLVLGFAAPAVVSYFALKRIQGLLVHANVKWRFGWLERVVATPFFNPRRKVSTPPL